MADLFGIAREAPRDTEWLTPTKLVRDDRAKNASFERGARLAHRALGKVKPMRRTLAFLGLLSFVGMCAACSSTSDGSSSAKRAPGVGIGDGEIPGAADGDHSAAPGASESAGAPSGGADSSATGAGATGGQGSVPSGVLTAGTWDDNRNFDMFLSYRAQAQSTAGAPPIPEQEHRDAFSLWSGSRPSKSVLDVSLVIDTTGSMGDEMAYLRSEFLAIHASIADKYPTAAQRWSLVVYKDVHDPYVVRWFDFRVDPNDFASHLAAQTADGGEDYPESPERALEIASQLAWRGDEAAKLAFWVTDAPHHEKDAAVMAQSIRDLRSRGVHLYPVAASGADALTEETMRAGAQLTGGRFLFLTDDSGIGNAHEVPRVPCFFVTKLNDAILRMIDVELTGQYHEPDASQVLRTGGDPQSGRCSLSGDQQATIF